MPDVADKIHDHGSGMFETWQSHTDSRFRIGVQDQTAYAIQKLTGGTACAIPADDAKLEPVVGYILGQLAQNIANYGLPSIICCQPTKHEILY